jgi:signal peptidase II
MTVATSPSVSRSARPTALNRVWTRYLSIAAAAAAADLISKEIAARALGEGHLVPLTDRFSLMLLYNTGTAGGFTVGPFTWTLNVLLTVAAIAMVMRIVSPLSAVDPRATSALALVSGGAFGNLASMLSGPNGVADFFAVRLSGNTTIVMNVADLMLWSGSLLLVPVVLRLIGIVRAERAALVR